MNQCELTSSAGGRIAEPMSGTWDYAPEADWDGDAYANWDYQGDPERRAFLRGGPGSWELTITKHPDAQEIGSRDLPEWDTEQEALDHAAQIIQDPNYDHLAVEGIEHLPLYDRHEVITAFAEWEQHYERYNANNSQDVYEEYLAAGLKWNEALERHGLEQTEHPDVVRLQGTGPEIRASHHRLPIPHLRAQVTHIEGKLLPRVDIYDHRIIDALHGTDAKDMDCRLGRVPDQQNLDQRVEQALHPRDGIER